MTVATRTGFCSLCRSDFVAKLNKLISDGSGYTNALRTLSLKDPSISFSKGTFLRHKEHVTSALITEAEAARSNPVVVPTSNKASLELIRDLGIRKIIEDPSKIGVSQTIRAAQILAESEKNVDKIVVLLAKAVQQDYLAEPIESTYKEIETNGS